ncbi:MAG: MFS transporter [Myxococcaceae bacterium]|nr:MFS transporter [Myxococcaceae bacterium]
MTARRLPAAWKLGLLSALYFVQGVPFGFQSKGLKLLLADDRAVPMTAVTLLGLLSLPWSLKPLWAPLVDRYGSARFGRRKSWIVPLMGLLALSLVAAGLAPYPGALLPLLGVVLLMNVFASMQDVPVDGLAVDLLGEHELGLGNAAQVAAYKVGMAVGGSVFIGLLLPRLGWLGGFVGLAAVVGLVLLAVLAVDEPNPPASSTGPSPRPGLREIARRAWQLVARPGGVWLLLFVATYKTGEALSDSVFEPFLQRVLHLPKEDVASYALVGQVGSLVGSVAGGLVATRLPLLRAVGVTAAVRALSLVAMWALAAGLVPSSAAVITAVTGVEHFFAGLVTTCMFAFMMSRVDRTVGATHFTLLAAVEVLGKAPAGLASGALVERLGWAPVFLVGAWLSWAFLGLLVPLRRHAAPATAS